MRRFAIILSTLAVAVAAWMLEGWLHFWYSSDAGSLLQTLFRPSFSQIIVRVIFVIAAVAVFHLHRVARKLVAVQQEDARKTLAETQRVFQSTLDSFESSLAVLDSEGSITAVNTAWRRFAAGNGINPDTVGIGVNYLAVCGKVVGDDDHIARQVADAIRDILNAKRADFHFEYACHSPDKQRWFMGTVSLLKDAKVPSLVVKHNDITELKLTEFRLAESLHQEELRSRQAQAMLASLRAVLENDDFLPAAKAILEQFKGLTGAAAGYIGSVSADGKTNEVLHLDPGSHSCAVDPSLPMPIRGLRELGCRNGDVVYDNDYAHSEWQKLVPPGHVSLENVLFAPMRIDGETVGLIGVANKPGGFTARDVELARTFADCAALAMMKSRNIETARRSEAYLRRLADSLPAFVCYVDSDMRYQFRNARHAECFGLSSYRTRGMKVRDVLGESLFAVVEPQLKKALAGEQVTYRFDINHPVKGPLIYESTLTPDRDSSGRVVGVNVLSVDITKKTQTERKIEANGKKLRQLVSQLCVSEERQRRRFAERLHDTVLQNLTLLKMKAHAWMGNRDDPHYAANLADMLGGLDAVMQEARSLTHSMSPPALHQLGLVPALEEWLQQRIRDKWHIETHLDADPDLPLLDNDIKSFLFRSICELAMNVAKHACANHLDIRITRRDDSIIATVTDNGTGCNPAEVLDFQSPGKHFGLFSIYNRVLYWGGTMDMESNPGAGTKVTLTLPLEPHPVESTG